jgi:serine protease
MNNLNEHSQFTNHGKCVDLYAPGEDIKSAWYDGAYKTMSGTSMASPHVAGVAALILAKAPWLLPPRLHDAVLERATRGIVLHSVHETPNLLAYAN